MTLETPPDPKLEPQSQPWGRWVSRSISGLLSSIVNTTASLRRLTADTAANFNRQQAQIRAMPLPVIAESSFTSFAMAGGFLDISNIAVPANKTKMSVVAIATLIARDVTSGGVASFTGGFVIEAQDSSGGGSLVTYWQQNGTKIGSTKFPATPLTGTSNSLVIPFSTSYSALTPGSILKMTLQAGSNNAAAFSSSADNQAIISVQYTFFE